MPATMESVVKRPLAGRRHPPEAWAASCQGPREENQDEYGRADHRTPHYNWRRRGCLYVVADGLGGLTAGADAARIAVREAIAHYRRSENYEDEAGNLLSAVRRANLAIYDTSRRLGVRMGATIVACVLRNGNATIAHAGDSRAYLLAKGELRRLTRDHLYATEVLGVKGDDEAKLGPEGNKITRALGKEPEVEADVTTVELSSEDRLLLCSDGLSEVVEADEIRECLLEPTPEQAVRELKTRAQDRLTDNATAVVVFASGARVVRRRRFAVAIKSLAAVLILGTMSVGGWRAWRHFGGPKLIATVSRAFTKTPRAVAPPAGPQPSTHKHDDGQQPSHADPKAQPEQRRRAVSQTSALGHGERDGGNRPAKDWARAGERRNYRPGTEQSNGSAERQGPVAVLPPSRNFAVLLNLDSATASHAAGCTPLSWLHVEASEQERQLISGRRPNLPDRWASWWHDEHARRPALWLDAVIGRDGHVEQAEPNRKWQKESDLPREMRRDLEKAAQDTVRRTWSYKPALDACGNPAVVSSEIYVQF
jgi:serine/threonine protein phosphatase PrpC